MFTALGIAIMTLAVSMRRSGRSSVASSSAGATRVRVMLALVALCYVAFLFAAFTLFDAQSTPDHRMLVPLCHR